MFFLVRNEFNKIWCVLSIARIRKLSTLKRRNGVTAWLPDGGSFILAWTFVVKIRRVTLRQNRFFRIWYLLPIASTYRLSFLRLLAQTWLTKLFGHRHQLSPILNGTSTEDNDDLVTIIFHSWITSLAS